MALNEAYGGTDVWSDPGWLRNTALGHGQLAHQAAERLQQLQQEKLFFAGHNQQAQQFAAAHAQQERQRQDALTESGRRHDETLAQQKLAQQQLEMYRQSQLSQGEEARKFQRSTGLLNLAQSYDPSITPAMKKSLYNMYLQSITEGGGQAPAAGQSQAPAPQTAAPATGGAPAPSGLDSLAPQTADPKAAKVAGFLANQNEPGVTPPATGQSQTGQPQSAGATFAPGNLIQTQDANTGVRSLTPTSQAYDLNPNTAEYVSHNKEGTINGQPAGQLLARMAAAHGRTPESASGQAAFQSAKVEAGNRQVGETTTPPMNVPNVDPDTQVGFSPTQGPTPAGPPIGFNTADITQPQQPQAPAPVAGAPAAAGPVTPEQIPTNQAGEPQYPSGAMSSGMNSGRWLADQFKQLPISVNQPSQDALAQELKRRQQMPGY